MRGRGGQWGCFWSWGCSMFVGSCCGGRDCGGGGKCSPFSFIFTVDLRLRIGRTGGDLRGEEVGEWGEGGGEGFSLDWLSVFRRRKVIDWSSQTLIFSFCLMNKLFYFSLP